MRSSWHSGSTSRLLAIAVCVSVFVPAVANAESSPVAPVNSTDGVAIKGYDPVAYFVAGKPTPGAEAHTYPWKGVTYRFASAENLERFKTDPERYVPQYGGYCAFAMSINRIADIDPARWAIVDGKLYLNNNFLSQTLWSVNKGSNIASADGNWKVLPKRPPVE
jgi:YHS domain-containing protein